MAKDTMTAQEKKWQAESDARTLAEAELVNSDPVRLEAAKGKLGEMTEEADERAKALHTVHRKLLKKKKTT